MNGYGGQAEVIRGKFSLTRDRGILVPVDGVRTPDLTYLRYHLEPLLRELAVGRRVDGRKNHYTKIYPGTVASVRLRLPSDRSGALDYELMTQVGEHLRAVEQRQRRVKQALDAIRTASVTIPCSEPSRTVSLGDRRLFELSIGLRVLRSQHVAQGIPVYSANVRQPFGYVAQSNIGDFTGDSLIWGIDGVFDWNLIPAKTPFATTDHCGRLLIKEKSLDPQYLLWALRASRSAYGFDRVYRANLSNVGSSIELPVPLDADGQFSLARQRDIARRHGEIDALRTTAVNVLGGVAEARLRL
jgi:hypothetical protein